MNRRLFEKYFPSISCALALALATPAHAQGLFAGSKGARVAGRGGAYGAKADDLYAVEYNPAGLTRLGKTTLQLSNRFSYNMLTYQRQATYQSAYPDNNGSYGLYVPFETVKNQQPWQAIDPMLGVGSNFGTKDFAAALVAYAPPGAARMSFPQGQNSLSPDPSQPGYAQPYDAGQRYMMVSREAEILIYALSLAYKYKNIFGVGATAQWIHVPRLRYSLVAMPWAIRSGVGQQVVYPLDMVSHIDAKDPFTFNAIVGAWVRPLPFLEFALSGQVVPAAIRAKGHMAVTQASNGQSLATSRNGQAADDVSITIPLPLWARFATRYVHRPGGEFKYDIELDVTYQSWSRVDTFALRSNGLTATQSALGDLPIGDVNVPKYWRDGLTFQLGGDYALLPQLLTLRAGAGFETAVSYPNYTNVDFATGSHISGAIGGSVYLGGFEIAMAYTYRRQLQVTVAQNEARVRQVTPCDPVSTTFCPSPSNPAPTVNAGTYNAFNHFLNLDVLYRF